MKPLAIFNHRMGLWLWISIALLVAIFFLSRHAINVTLYKIALITIAGYIGYMLSLAIEGCVKVGPAQRKRPHEMQQEAALLRGRAERLKMPEKFEAHDRAWQLEQLAVHMLWRRSVVVGAVLLAAAMGA